MVGENSSLRASHRLRLSRAGARSTTLRRGRVLGPAGMSFMASVPSSPPAWRLRDHQELRHLDSLKSTCGREQVRAWTCGFRVERRSRSLELIRPCASEIPNTLLVTTAVPTEYNRGPAI